MITVVDEFGNKYQLPPGDINVQEYLRAKAKAYFLDPNTRRNEYKLCVVDFENLTSTVHVFEFSLSSALY